MDWIAKYWLEFLFGLVLSGLGFSIKFIWTKIKAFNNGLQALLRDKIVQSYYESMEKGYCPIYKFESINLMYQEYHRLGGNSFVTQLVNELKELPKIKSNEEDNNK